MLQTSERSISPTLSQGLLFGALLGAVALAYNLLNSFVSLGPSSSDVLNVSLVAFMVVGFGLAALRVAYQTRDVMSGMLAALFASLISSAIGLATLWLITLVFMDTLRFTPIMMRAFEAAGSQTNDKIIVRDALSASFFGPMLSFVLAVALGVVGGLIGKSRTAVYSQPAKTLPGSGQRKQEASHA